MSEQKEGQDSSSKRVIYAVNDGIASSQSRKKYSYNFKRFIDHIEGINQESLVAKAEKEPRVLGAMII